MKMTTSAMVSNSEMIKNYKTCRDKAEIFGKLFVLKNNQPDAVLFSVSEYERLSSFIEFVEGLEDGDIAKAIESMQAQVDSKACPIDHLTILLKEEV